jgi:hypothetical protein
MKAASPKKIIQAVNGSGTRTIQYEKSSAFCFTNSALTVEALKFLLP